MVEALPLTYFQQEDTLALARDLIGKTLITRFNGKVTSGYIVETEAYLGISDRASHAYGGRRTTRTETMYLPGGHAYVYLCYGIHHLFNIVTHQKDVPHAILIRALQPAEGVEIMMERRNKMHADATLTRGPGSLSGALGLHKCHSGIILKPSTGIYIGRDNNDFFNSQQIISGPRIGVDYAGEDATLPYRFFVAGNPFVSKPNR